MAMDDLMLQREVPGDQPCAEHDDEPCRQCRVEEGQCRPAAIDHGGKRHRRPFDRAPRLREVQKCHVAPPGPPCIVSPCDTREPAAMQPRRYAAAAASLRMADMDGR